MPTLYRADFRDKYGYFHDSVAKNPKTVTWVPAIHMQKLNARIWLKVTRMRMEHVQEITDGDVFAEGIVPHPGEKPRDAFARIWEKCYGLWAWNVNPLVWVIEFERIEK